MSLDTCCEEVTFDSLRHERVNDGDDTIVANCDGDSTQEYLPSNCVDEFIISDNDSSLSSPTHDNDKQVVTAVETRNMRKQREQEVDVGDSFIFKVKDEAFDKSNFTSHQKSDVSLQKLFSKVVNMNDLNEFDTAYFVKNDILYRKYYHRKSKSIYTQIVVPHILRQKLMSVAHDLPLSGHLGKNKMYAKMMKTYHWPKMYNDIAYYCRSCHKCQMMSCPSRTLPKAPLHPIQTKYPNFHHVIIDCVGPLTTSKSGCKYLLTVMCATSRFPHAIPLKNIRAKTITRELLKYFCITGFPQVIQSDQGSNFKSEIFKQFCHNLCIQHNFSTVYHPQSQGSLERFHQTFKSMLKKFADEKKGNWDEYVSLLLFAARNHVQDSLGYSAFDVVFGNHIRGPLEMIKSALEDNTHNVDIDTYVDNLHTELRNVQQFANKNLQSSQDIMKQTYDVKSKLRQFKENDSVLVYIPNNNSPWRTQYIGPCKVLKKVNNLNYLISLPGRKNKCKLFHINLLKPYYTPTTNPVLCINPLYSQESPLRQDLRRRIPLDHLSTQQQDDVLTILQNYSGVLRDVPSRTTAIEHDIQLTEPKFIKSPPYRVNPMKRQILRQEVEKLLNMGIIQPSSSPYASPCILVPKPDGSHRLVVDYRKINEITVPDAYPMPRIDELLDSVSSSAYVTKIDLLKGFYAVPLTPRAQQISAFVTPEGLYEFLVMPFGMKNAPATFNRLVSKTLSHLSIFCRVFIDDIIIFSNTWEEHLRHLDVVLACLRENNLTVNIDKFIIGNGELNYLGFKVGSGRVAPVDAKVKGILEYARPRNKRELMRFLGMAGFYRRFCPHYSDMAKPLTDLLQQGVKFAWSDSCEQAFVNLKTMLGSSPVLRSPDFNLEFYLAVDASDFALGAVLLQEHEGTLMPVSYFSRKFSKAQLNYSTIEKELLALVEACTFFEIYLSSGKTVTVLTDHNPLVHLARLKHSNQRLLRWSLRLQEFPLQIEHISGRSNIIADALSRSVTRSIDAPK